MSRKVHVRFLGDKGGVIRLRYPTKKTDDSKFKLINSKTK